MAQPKAPQVRDENPRQGFAHRGNDPKIDADRERSIQPEKEQNKGSGMSRRQPTTPVYGSPYGSTASPFTAMRRMAEDMDRLFENFGFGRMGLGLTPAFGAGLGREHWNDGRTSEGSVWHPQVETFRRGDQLVVRADLPGLNKDDVKVEIDDGILTISGERCEEHEDNRENVYRSERSYGQFYRAIPLPDGVNGDRCDASFKDGVLEVTLAAPKPAERKAKQIVVK